jgi:hypothetical protein
VTDSPPNREDYDDSREFIRDWENYWDNQKPSPSAIVRRAASVANDAAVAIDMQLGVFAMASLGVKLTSRRCRSTSSSHKTVGGYRQQVVAGFPDRTSAKALQRSPQQCRSVIPLHQGLVVTLDMHQPVVHRPLR